MTTPADQPHPAMGASWAPDGSKIAFAMDGAIWTVNSVGSDLRLSARVSHNVRGVEWSRHGPLALDVEDERACAEWFCFTAVAITNANGTGFRLLASAQEPAMASLGDPEWSADATLVAYNHSYCYGLWGCERTDVVVVRADNGEEAIRFANAYLVK